MIAKMFTKQAYEVNILAIKVDQTSFVIVND